MPPGQVHRPVGKKKAHPGWRLGGLIGTEPLNGQFMFQHSLWASSFGVFRPALSTVKVPHLSLL